MKTIWKHPIMITDVQSVSMPAGSTLLSVQQQYGKWQGWFLVPDTDAPATRIEVVVAGTGNPFPYGSLRYVCTSQEPGLCWHFFTDDGAGL